MTTIASDGAAPPASALPPSQPAAQAGVGEGKRRAIVIGVVVVVVAALAGAIWLAVTLVNNPVQAASVRDVFIIFMALEFMILGVAMVILIFQLAVLTNMLRHEIKPILESTNETVSTLRGTTVFLSDNLVEPVMKLNSYVAAIGSMMESLGGLVGFGRRR